MARGWRIIPDDPELGADLTAIMFDYSRLKVRHGGIILESKDDCRWSLRPQIASEMA